MRILAVINQKGGCGKTTTSINLSAVLAQAGQRTLLVDLDPQSHCAAGLGVPEPRLDLDIGEVMRAEDPVQADRLLWPVSRCLDLAPSRMSLAGLEAIGGGIANRPDKELRLTNVLSQLEARYDVCVIDCSPSIGLLTFNALTAADAALVPVETSFFSLQGATKQLSTVRALSRRLQREVATGLVPTLHDTESARCEDLLDELRRRFGSKVVPAVIRRDQSLKEAASFGQPIIEYDAQSRGAQDYLALGQWVMQALVALDQHSPAAPAAPEASATVVRTDDVNREGLARKVLGTAANQLDQLQARARALADRLADRVQQPAEAPDELVGMQPDTGDAARRLFGARHTTSGVLFVQPLALGECVQVVGSFADGQRQPMCRNETMGVYELCLPLPVGEHRYRLNVDGHTLADPYNSEWQLDAEGNPNSIVRVVSHSKPEPSETTTASS